jgi:Tol biopolymer transport system component
MPAWSPDGQRIAFMSLREGYCAVFLMNADGSNQTNLTPKGANDPASAWCSRAPSWSRNGRIYFMSFRPSTSGDVEVFSMADDGTNLVRLTTSAGEDGGPRLR